MNELILINKTNLLETDINERELVSIDENTFNGETFYIHYIIVDSLKRMFSEAKKQNLMLCVCSAHRTIEEQRELYNINSYAAFPGASEHHTGLAVDIVNGDMTLNDLNNNPMIFENTPEFKWLSEHCYDFGFILRYPKGKEDITGIPYEPWHYRYIGLEHARNIRDSKLTLEEYIKNKGKTLLKQ